MFKLGDKVIVNKKSQYDYLINKTGIVCGFYRDRPQTILVYFKGWHKGHNGAGASNDTYFFFRTAGITDYDMSCYFIDGDHLTLLSSQLEFDFNE